MDFWDSDAYKMIEAMSYGLQIESDGDAAIKNADLIVSIFGENGTKKATSGHQEIELDLSMDPNIIKKDAGTLDPV